MRITEKILQTQIENLNKAVKIKSGYNVPGCYHLDCAYGGYALYVYTGKNGSVNDVFRVGHVPKRELYGLISAYAAGILRGAELCTK